MALEKVQFLAPVELKELLEEHAKARFCSLTDLLKRFCVEGLEREGGLTPASPPPASARAPDRSTRGGKKE